MKQILFNELNKSETDTSNLKRLIENGKPPTLFDFIPFIGTKSLGLFKKDDKQKNIFHYLSYRSKLLKVLPYFFDNNNQVLKDILLREKADSGDLENCINAFTIIDKNCIDVFTDRIDTEYIYDKVLNKGLTPVHISVIFEPTALQILHQQYRVGSITTEDYKSTLSRHGSVDSCAYSPLEFIFLQTKDKINKFFTCNIENGSKDIFELLINATKEPGESIIKNKLEQSVQHIVQEAKKIKTSDAKIIFKTIFQKYWCKILEFDDTNSYSITKFARLIELFDNHNKSSCVLSVENWSKLLGDSFIEPNIHYQIRQSILSKCADKVWEHRLDKINLETFTNAKVAIEAIGDNEFQKLKSFMSLGDIQKYAELFADYIEKDPTFKKKSQAFFLEATYTKLHSIIYIIGLYKPKVTEPILKDLAKQLGIEEFIEVKGRFRAYFIKEYVQNLEANDLLATTGYISKQRFTAYDIACKLHKLDLAQVLLHRGLNLDIYSNNIFEIFKTPIKVGSSQIVQYLFNNQDIAKIWDKDIPRNWHYILVQALDYKNPNVEVIDNYISFNIHAIEDIADKDGKIINSNTGKFNILNIALHNLATSCNRLASSVCKFSSSTTIDKNIDNIDKLCDVIIKMIQNNKIYYADESEAVIHNTCILIRRLLKTLLSATDIKDEPNNTLNSKPNPNIDINTKVDTITSDWKQKLIIDKIVNQIRKPIVEHIVDRHYEKHRENLDLNKIISEFQSRTFVNTQSPYAESICTESICTESICTESICNESVVSGADKQDAYEDCTEDFEISEPEGANSHNPNSVSGADKQDLRVSCIGDLEISEL